MLQKNKKDMQSCTTKVKGLVIEIGHQVLLANKTERGKTKVADRWEFTVYTVVDRKPDTQVQVQVELYCHSATCVDIQ